MNSNREPDQHLGCDPELDQQGSELVSQNADDPFVAASVVSLTVRLAMEVLGGDYRRRRELRLFTRASSRA
jgi:hypothetical protein